MNHPHPAQLRLLSFLALAPADRFVDLAQIESARQVRPGDDLFVPSLAARGWVEMDPAGRAGVRITDAGRAILVGPERDAHARQTRRDRPSARDA